MYKKERLFLKGPKDEISNRRKVPRQTGLKIASATIWVLIAMVVVGVVAVS